jgi:retron-type reverse transcriptase
LTERWKKDLDEGKAIGIISMDLSKAFDSITHELLLEKLKAYGADNQVYNLLRNYLENRHQRVKLDDEYSRFKKFKKGVPQGSILGPLLFNVFMNDLEHATSSSDLATYADDTQVFHANRGLENIEKVINEDLKNTDEWFKNNGMTRNKSKYPEHGLGQEEETNRDAKHISM